MLFDNLFFDQPHCGFDPWAQQYRRAEAERRRQAAERDRRNRAAEMARRASCYSSGEEGEGERQSWGAQAKRKPGFPHSRMRSMTESPFSMFMRPKCELRRNNAPQATRRKQPEPPAPPAPPAPCPPQNNTVDTPIEQQQQQQEYLPSADNSSFSSSRSSSERQPVQKPDQPADPTPSPAATAALSEIASILKAGAAIKRQWAGAFTPIESEEQREQVRKERAYFEEGLLQQVIKLDGVDTCGDPAVRKARKNAVVSLEQSVAELKAFAEQHDFDKQAQSEEPNAEKEEEESDVNMSNTSEYASAYESE